MAEEARDDDWELLRRATPDDTSSFERLVSRHYRQAVAFCQQILGDHQKAEDIVQKGFVNIFQARERYEHRARFKTFLFKVLLNLCINELNRKRGPIPLSSVAADDEGDLTGAHFHDRSSPDPTRGIESEEALAMIKKGVMQLPPKHRAALYLREYGQMPYAEIATALGASLGEVKIWIHRGRNRLQEILRPYLERGEPIK